MNKMKIVIKKVFFLIMLSNLGVIIYAQNSSGIDLGFENKKGILEWGKKEFGYCDDSINYNIEGRNIFILYGDYAYGVSYKTIFIFYEINGGAWGLFCMRRTNTSKVTTNLDNERKELVFRSKSGKILFTLPFETIKLEYDSSEQ